MLQSNRECHSRIIWSCSFGTDNNLFVTGSRDKSIKVWFNDPKTHKYENVLKHEFEDCVTAVEILQHADKRILLVGLENGEILINSINIKDSYFELKHLGKSHPNISLGSRVKRIRSVIKEDNKKVLIAACGDDYTVRIYSADFSIFQ